MNGLTGVLGILLIPIGVVIMVAALWLWAGDDPRRNAAVLGAPAVASIALALSVLVTKADALGFGFAYASERVNIELGVYVLLAGGVLAVVAAVIASLPARTLPPSVDEPAPPE